MSPGNLLEIIAADLLRLPVNGLLVVALNRYNLFSDRRESYFLPSHVAMMPQMAIHGCSSFQEMPPTLNLLQLQKSASFNQTMKVVAEC